MRWQDYLLLLLLGGTGLLYYLPRRRLFRGKRSLSGRRRERLTRREEAAWQQLQAEGYRLETIAPAVPFTLTVENKNRSFTRRGGFTVVKGGKTYLVKVKKEAGPPLATPLLRRELILDFLLFQPAGLFLYDSEKDRLQKMHFSLGEGTGGGAENRLLQLALVLLIAVGAAFFYRLLF